MTEHLPSPGTGGLTSLPLSPASSGLTPHAGEDRPTDIHSVQRNVSAGQRPVSPSVPPVRALRDAAVTFWSRGPPWHPWTTHFRARPMNHRPRRYTHDRPPDPPHP